MLVVEFSTSRFLPFLPEECQVNPGAYGFELAYWLSRALLSKGYATSYPESEDWGWYIEYIQDNGIEISIGCSSQSNPGDGYIGSPICWAIFVKQHFSFSQRIRGKSDSPKLAEITSAIEFLLNSEGVATQRSDGAQYGKKV